MGVGKKGQRYSPWVDGGVVAGLVQRTRNGEEGVRGVEVPTCFYFPATASRRGSLQRLLARRRRRAAQPRLLLLLTRTPPLLLFPWRRRTE
jgi:hypothetical protein